MVTAEKVLLKTVLGSLRFGTKKVYGNLMYLHTLYDWETPNTLVMAAGISRRFPCALRSTGSLLAGAAAISSSGPIGSELPSIEGSLSSNRSCLDRLLRLPV